MTIIHDILNLRSHYEGITFLEAVMAGGPLFLLILVIALLSVPIALFVIFRFRARGWSLFASVAPFCLAALACHINSLSVFGYMGGPKLETVLGDLGLQIQIFWLGCAATLVLALLSLIVPTRKPADLLAER